MIPDLKIRDIQELVLSQKVDIFVGIRLISVYSRKDPSGFDVAKIVSIKEHSLAQHVKIHPRSPVFETITCEEVFDVVMQILEQVKNNQQELNFYRLRLDPPNDDQFEYQVKIDPPMSGVQIQDLRIEDLT